MKNYLNNGFTTSEVDYYFNKGYEQGRADTIAKIRELMKPYVNYENVDIFIEALGQLEKQNNSKNLRF